MGCILSIGLISKRADAETAESASYADGNKGVWWGPALAPEYANHVNTNEGSKISGVSADAGNSRLPDGTARVRYLLQD